MMTFLFDYIYNYSPKPLIYMIIDYGHTNNLKKLGKICIH